MRRIITLCLLAVSLLPTLAACKAPEAEAAYRWPQEPQAKELEALLESLAKNVSLEE